MRYRNALPSIVVAAMALAGRPAAAQVSHQGQDINEHVVLRDGGLTGRFEAVCPATASFKDKALFRVWPDGTRAAEPFSVAAGKRLVITDVEWTVDSTATGLSLTPGDTVRTRLQIGSGATFTSVFLSRTVEVGPAGGYVSGSEQLTTGVVVAPNTAICPNSAEFGTGIVKSVRLLEIVLRGYLISAQ